eukprot:TRINITY_DN11561_c0_g1_i1.p1 TRINITY_DN11561_c0_g1~~TRINITY_DN11561_c0_g1_i1.p1  ORF type:complete len:308 (-),score=88.23 TRINITY_DN11561_c0_g1_i1:186-1109(-)
MWSSRLATEAPKGNPRAAPSSQPSRMAAMLRSGARPHPGQHSPQPSREPVNTYSNSSGGSPRTPTRTPQQQYAAHTAASPRASPASRGGGEGALVAIWDFDDTLVPWYKMKRAHGDSSVLALFDQWFHLNQSVQQALLQQSDSSWEGASRVSRLSGSAQRACRAAWGTNRDSLGTLGGCSIARLEQSTEARFNGWLAQARIALQRVRAAGGINLLVTAAPLCAAVAKSMIFGFDNHFELHHVYSAAEDMSGKTKTIQMAMADGARALGGSDRFVVVGDGKAEEKSAKELRLPFVKVRGWEDLHKARP